VSLHPAVALVRRHVRAALADLDPGAAVVVACSGGADSLALLAGTVFEGHKAGLPVIGATVDHGLQDDSEARARRVVEQMAALGADGTYGVRVHVQDPGGHGPEAAARHARYAVLGQVAERAGAPVVLLGHTRDDQAETVLLGLARGSGGRSIAGMRRAYQDDTGPVSYRRPLLDVSRTATEAACLTQGIEYWTDPHNSDPAYTRSRVRQRVLPVLEEELGPGVAAALARTADSLREDMELLDDTAEAAYRSLVEPASGVEAEGLAAQPTPIRRRVLRLLALAAGAPASELTREHVLAVDALVTDWRGQRWIDLPGHLRAVRRDGHIRVEAAPAAKHG